MKILYLRGNTPFPRAGLHFDLSHLFRFCQLSPNSHSITFRNEACIFKVYSLFGTIFVVALLSSCSLRDLSPSLVEENRVCGSVSGGGVCYSGDSVGSVAVYFCDDGYILEGDTTRECLSSGLWNGTIPQCIEIEGRILKHKQPHRYFIPSHRSKLFQYKLFQFKLF